MSSKAIYSTGYKNLEMLTSIRRKIKADDIRQPLEKLGKISLYRRERDRT